MSRRLPAHVQWALGVLRDNGYKGTIERDADGKVKTVIWSPPAEEDTDE